CSSDLRRRPPAPAVPARAPHRAARRGGGGPGGRRRLARLQRVHPEARGGRAVKLLADPAGPGPQALPRRGRRGTAAEDTGGEAASPVATPQRRKWSCGSPGVVVTRRLVLRGANPLGAKRLFVAFDETARARPGPPATRGSFGRRRRRARTGRGTRGLGRRRDGVSSFGRRRGNRC